MRVPLSVLGAISLLISAAAGAVSQSTANKPSGFIEGQVSLDGKPVAGAILTAVPKAIPGQPNAGLVTTEANADGHFRIEVVPGLAYIVSARAPAYVVVTDKPVTVGERETIEGIDLRLRRGGVITGRVTGSLGQPIVSTRVDLIQLDEDGSHKIRLIIKTDSDMYTTDDRGVYRLYGVPPGRYRVAVGVPTSGGVSRYPAGYYPRTFHPDVADESQAKVIEIGDGTQATDVDIAVRAFSKAHNVSGRIVDADSGEPAPGLAYGYGAVSAEGAYAGSVAVVGRHTTTKGEFFIDGLTPGRYAAFVVNEGSAEYYSDAATFEVAEADVTGIEIKLQHGASISGAAVIEGSPAPAAFAELLKATISVEVLPAGLTSLRTDFPQLSENGQFYVGGLRPGTATILVHPPRQTKRTLVVSRIERDGNEVASIDLKPAEHVTGVRLVLRYVEETGK